MPRLVPNSSREKNDQFRVSLLPMTSVDDPKINIQTIKKAIAGLSSDVQMLCLPENSLYLNLGKTPIPKEKAFSEKSPEIQELQEICQKKKLNLHMGGIPWWYKGEVCNEALLIKKNGELVETYEKMHLFDVNLGPGLEISESKSYRPGHRFNIFDIDGWRFATCICYDLRFPEIFLHYVEEHDVDTFLVPAAFTTKTGEIHWKSLLLARAIETQCYVLAAAQVGYHRNGENLRKSWGQSLAIGPWGDVLHETADYRDFLDSGSVQHLPITLTMFREKIESYRQSVPVQDHRRFHMGLVKK